MLDLPIPNEHSSVVRTLAHEYDDAPTRPAGRVGHLICLYWEDYGKWVRERAAALRKQYQIKECRFEAYGGASDLTADTAGGRLIVTRDYAPHPLFDVETNQALRIVHDLDGHAAAGQGFTWAEEVQALREQARRTPPRFLPALFAQTLHQLASTTHNRRFPEEQKLLLSDHCDWRTILLGTTRALANPTGRGHTACSECDVPHPHSHLKEEIERY